MKMTSAGSRWLAEEEEQEPDDQEALLREERGGDGEVDDACDASWFRLKRNAARCRCLSPAAASASASAGCRWKVCTFRSALRPLVLQ